MIAASSALQYTNPRSPRTEKPARRKLPDDLPRDMVTLDIPEEEKQCDCFGKERKAFGHESSCKLNIITAQVKVIEFQRFIE